MSAATEHRPADKDAPQSLQSIPVIEGSRSRWRRLWSRKAFRSKVVLGVLVAAGSLLVVAALVTLTSRFAKTSGGLIFDTVRRGDLAITVTERGNLKSQNEVKIVCEVADIRGDGIDGTPIQWIVPNGFSVKKDDLLVELDVSAHQERLDEQILKTERARSDQIQAEVKHENQKTQNETNLEEAKLQVALAELTLRQFEDEEGGTFQISLQDVELLIQEAQAGRLIEETNLEGVEQLFKLGYRSSGELAQARLSAMQAERKLATAISKKRELVEYQYRATRLELEGKVASARRALLQVERDNDALLEQARAEMEAANESLKKEEERLARYREYVEKCKIYAPQDGMVAYHVSRHRWHRREILAGAPVRLQQNVLSLPSLSKMQVETAVHESVLFDIRPGLAATILVDAFSDRSYGGTVQTVAVLPDQGSWMSSDTKMYETIVTVDEEVENLKPGMTAVVEIQVDLLRDVLSVPVTAVLQESDRSWCYVDTNGSPERRPVTPGRTNERQVEIREGLQEGERVVLNPDAIVDKSEKDESPAPPREESPRKRQEEPSRREKTRGPDSSVERQPKGSFSEDRSPTESRPEGRQVTGGSGRGDGQRRRSLP